MGPVACTGLWVLFTEKDARDQARVGTTIRSKDIDSTEPVPGIRRYVNIDEYIKSGENPYFESYAGRLADTVALPS